MHPLTEGARFESSPRAVSAREVVATSLIVASILIAVVLRWFHLGALSIWWDEGITALGSSYSPLKIVRFAQRNDTPPLYFLLLHYWGALFGNSEYALRALSALFGTLSLPVFYFLARKVLKDSMAVALATWLFAFSMMQVWFSREARTYELASFFALLGLYAAISFLERRSLGLFAVMALSAATSIYLHNMMFFYLFALNITFLVYPSRRPWTERLKELFAVDALAGILFLPWLPSLLGQINVDVVSKAFWAPRPTIAGLFGTFAYVSGFNLDYLTAVAGKLVPFSPRLLFVCVAVGVSVLSAALLAGGFWRVASTDKRRNLSLVLYCLVPILAVFVFSRVSTSVYIDRVFIDSSIVIPIIFAYPLALQKQGFSRILYAVLGTVLAASIALSGLGYLRYQQKEDWRDASSTLLNIPEKNRLVVFVGLTGEFLFDYYTQRFGRTDPQVTKMALPLSYLDAFPPPPFKALTSESDFSGLKTAVESTRYSEIDLILSHELYCDPEGLVENYLTRNLNRDADDQFYGIRIVRFLAPSH